MTTGATVGDWAHFAQTLGLEADLLPVVSDQSVKISPQSAIKELGKTPSTVNGRGEAVGVLKWSTRQTTDRDVARWRKDNRQGICVQTRNVRAIDVDIADPAHSRRVLDAIELYLEQVLPMRSRADSGKFLLAFHLRGEYAKRVLHCQHGIIEFLANGQQFIAVGTHPKGERYVWSHESGAGLPDAIPELTAAQFEGLWSLLASLFAIEPERAARGVSRRPASERSADDMRDPVVTYLQDAGWVKNFERDGRVNVRCPWEADHTTDTGDTATQWFPAGVGGFEQGHFRCLHAHCEHRGDADFLHETGYAASHFDDITQAVEVVDPDTGEITVVEAEPVAKALPPFARKRDGSITADVGNLEKALRRADVCGLHIVYDSFKDEIMLADYSGEADGAAGWHTLQWRTLTDADYTRMRILLGKKGFEPVGREMIRDVVALVAADCQMDTAQEWLQRLPAWDGVARVARFWSRYFRTADTPYTRAAGEYAWTALAGRVLRPGVKVDMVPVLIGRQGTGKTTGVAAMAPTEATFAELSLSMKDDDLSRRMRGRLVGEIGELRGLNSRDSDAIKQWVSRTHEEWVPKFKEFGTKFPRRLLIVGTTNREEFLADEEGEERRWLPLRVGLTDLEALVADRDQLWAEGKVLFESNGVMWREAQELARAVHGEHRVADAWDERVRAWLLEPAFGDEDGKPQGLGPIHGTDVLTSALGMDISRISRGDEMRVAKVLKGLGFEKHNLRRGGSQAKLWLAAETCSFLHAYKSDEDFL